MSDDFETRRKAFLERKARLMERANILGTQHHGVVSKRSTSEVVEISLPAGTEITLEMRQFLIEWTSLHYWGGCYYYKVRTENGRDFHQLCCYTD